MDHYDIWKQNLGTDLYKERANLLAIDHSTRQLIQQRTSESNISMQESKEIARLLFKEGKGHLHDSWKQGFYFDQKIKYGVYQDQGGPCGILATV